MSYLFLTTGFGLGVDHTPFTLYEDRLDPSADFGGMLHAISMY